MKILSVNTGKAEPIAVKSGQSGIFKRPRQGRVAIGPLGLEGDVIIDTQNHGGPDQAVYLYGQPDYEFWENELGRELAPGLFGENLTVSGLESARMMVGDRLRIGKVLLEITSPRNPCMTFARVMGEEDWVKRFTDAQRPGVYARVIETGDVGAGDAAELIPFQGEKIPVTELTTDYRKPSPERMRWLLKAPLHTELREKYERALTELQAQQAQQQ
jgi:MOSC domain-containing protein YiiM